MNGHSSYLRRLNYGCKIKCLQQEILLCPICWCLPSHWLEWSHEFGGTSTIDILTKEPHSHGWTCKFFFFFFFLIFKLLFDLWFECVFGYLNAWVLLYDGFRGKPNVLGGIETCLRWILDDASLKMS